MTTSGLLDMTQPRIIHDLENPAQPQSVRGILVETLARRRQRGLAPFTVLSCDNIPNNGHVVKNAVLGMAEKRDSELAQWITEHVSFPGTMVDRIVPAATDESLAEIEAPCWEWKTPARLAASRLFNGLSKITLLPVARTGKRLAYR